MSKAKTNRLSNPSSPYAKASHLIIPCQWIGYLDTKNSWQPAGPNTFTVALSREVHTLAPQSLLCRWWHRMKHREDLLALTSYTHIFGCLMTSTFCKGSYTVIYGFMGLRNIRLEIITQGPRPVIRLSSHTVGDQFVYNTTCIYLRCPQRQLSYVLPRQYVENLGPRSWF